MLKSLELRGIGPASLMHLNFGERLNVLTGDNGLGKSFLLDIAFWSMTRHWPASINPKLTSGTPAVPRNREKPAEIEFSFTGKTRPVSYCSKFDRGLQNWTGQAGRPANPGLVIYAMADGSFAVWDPARNYWRTKGNIDVQERRPAFVFSPQEVWDELPGEDGRPLCNGLIRDVASWQREKGRAWSLFCASLNIVSPNNDEKLCMGELTRTSLDDARDIPTLRMPYGIDVPVNQASAGIRRILALVYLLVWAWEEHVAASRLLGSSTTDQLVFLVDEIECHLHPKWQFSVIDSLLKVVNGLAIEAKVQLIAATHSPQILTSLELLFDPVKDAWFDLDIVFQSNARPEVQLTQRVFEPHGTVGHWLTSPAFDLSSDRAPAVQALLDRASTFLGGDNLDLGTLASIYQELLKALNPQDSFLYRWRAQAERKGLKL